jgi:hypothetical protein
MYYMFPYFRISEPCVVAWVRKLVIHRSIINYMIVYDKVLYYKLLVKQLIQIGKKDKWMVWIENLVVPVV